MLLTAEFELRGGEVQSCYSQPAAVVWSLGLTPTQKKVESGYRGMLSSKDKV